MKNPTETTAIFAADSNGMPVMRRKSRYDEFCLHVASTRTTERVVVVNGKRVRITTQYHLVR